MSRQHFPNRWVIIAALLLGVFTASAEENDLAARLKAIHFDYTNREQPVDFAVLVRLDQELRAVVAILNAGDWRVSHTYMQDGYERLGLFLDHWNNTLQYSGLLLARAHAQNPNSMYREYTLFSATNFDARKGDTGAMPDINAAYQYLSEFPEGPFISEVYELLATFYDDFYKSLRHFMYGKVYEEDVRMACFNAYMTHQPHGVQATQTQVLAHHFYEKALSTAGEDAHWRATIEEEFGNFNKMVHAVEKQNYERWYWCSEC